MNSFLCKLFIKDFDNCKDPKVRESCGRFAGIVGIISNVILCIGKILIGVIAGSIAIIADGVNNLADASSSLITLIGFKLSAMPEDEEHPYGHARYEYITGMIVSVLIVVVGIELLKSSIEKVLNPSPLDFSIPVVVVLALAIVIKIWQSSFNVSLGKKINSLTLIATGTDSRNDVIATTVVLISVVLGHLANIQIDGYMGCLVALFIIWSGIQLVRETASPLLGETPDEEIVEQINSLARHYDGVLGTHDLVVHNYGPGKVFASIHIEVDADGDLMASHDMIDNIEKNISKQLHIEIVAHLDPIRISDPIRNEILAVVEKTVEDIKGVTNVHDLRLVLGPTHTNIIFDVLVLDSCQLTHKDIHNRIQDAVQQMNPNYYVVINYDRGYLKEIE